MLVLYGSETGNAQDVAGMLSAYMKQAVTDCCALPMDCVTLEELSTEEHVLYVCSTTGQGDVPQGMQHMWKSLLRKSLSNSLFSKMQYAVFGLGDSGYVQFNVVAKKLDRRLQQLGAKRLIDLGLGDDQDSGGYETALDPWIDALFAALPSVVDTGVASRPSMPPSEAPKFYVRTFATDKPAATSNGEEATEAPDGRFRAACRASAAFSVLGGVASGSKPWSDLSHLGATSSQHGEHASRSIENPFWAEVVKTERLTAADHWQVVQHIELDIQGSGMKYSPGDLLVTLPEVSHSAGIELLQCLGIDADATVCVGIDLSALPHRLQPQVVEGTCSHSAEFSAPALAVATGVLDVAGAPPRRRLFAALAACATEEVERKRLLHFASPEGRDDLATYCSRERRTLLEVLKDFPSAKLSMVQMLQVAPLLKPRQFSISSSPGAHPGRVHVTVAEVDYRTPYRRRIKGVCSSWLAALPVGAKIPVWIEKGALTLPPPEVPLICVGPGTGVAPFRSFLHERAALLQSGVTVAPSVLAFGCRNEAKDFLYAEEWREFMRLGVLKPDSGLLCAFSRDQPSKRYVQHCIREKTGMLWPMLRDENASVFVAGSAEKMPEAVALAFVDVISAGLLCSETEAKALQRRLEAAKRYCVEAWG